MVVFILITNFAVREVASTFVHGRHNYSENYSVAISLAYGKGFGDLDLTNARYSDSINQFLSFERQYLTPDELNAYFANAYHRTAPPLMVVERTLDLRLAALLWRVFGFNWTVLTRFYALFSTFVCLLIFFTARRLAGSYWAGFFASCFYATSLIECWLATWSVRDISPLWFSAVAFFWLVCFTDRGKSKLWNFLTITMLGVLSLLGYGWRIDAFLLPPFLLAVLVAWLLERRRSASYILLSASLFGLGAWGMRTLTRHLGSEELYTMTPQAGFHVADYGESTRSNLFSIENSFEIPRDDGETYDLASYYWHTLKPSQALPVYLSPEYAVATREMYGEYIRYNAFNWISGFPRFYLNTLGNVIVPGTLLKNMGTIPLPNWALWFGDRLSLIVALLFVIAALPMLAVAEDKALIVGVYFFSLYYCVLFLLVLPEGKHTGIFVLPLSIVIGFIAHAVLTVVSERGQVHKHFQISGVLRPFTVTLFLLFASWGVAAVGSYYYSRAERSSYIHDLLERAANTPDNIVSDRHEFSATVKAQAPAQGFLLKIRNQGPQSLLIAQHVRKAGLNESLPEFAYTTTHALYPNRDQYYFVTAVPALYLGDRRDYSCIVTLEGTSEIVSVKNVDLSTWKHPAFNTVFYEGETIAGSPKVFPEIRATAMGRLDRDFPDYHPPLNGPYKFVHFSEQRNPELLRLESSEEDLAAAFPLSLWSAQTGTIAARDEGVLRIQTPAEQFAFAMKYPPIQAMAASGTYMFELRYSLTFGDFRFGFLSPDGHQWFSGKVEDGREGSDLVRTVSIHLNSGQMIVPVIKNEQLLGDMPSKFTIRNLRCLFFPDRN